MTGLKISNVVKTFGSTTVLRGISLDVAPGELLTLLGASGSGKTTLLKIVAGFEQCDAGTVSIQGKDVNSVSPSDRDIGMVFQNYALFPHMTVEQNVAFPLNMRRISKAEVRSRVREVLSMVDLDDYGKRYPKQLSGGQQQRVALARAVVFHPKILLLDEPFGALDRKLRETLQLQVRRLQRRLGLTTIFITHDQEEALTMSDRIAVIGNGELWQVGTPRQIYELPIDERVANFIGESNIYVARVKQLSGSRQEVTLPFGNAVIVPERNIPKDKSTVKALVRPESVRVGPGSSTSNSITISATIEDEIYIGQSTKYRARVGDTHILVNKAGNDVTPETLAPGGQIEISIPADALHLLAS